MICPCCGMPHEDPQANRGRCRMCPCVDKLRDMIAELEFRCGIVYKKQGRKGGSAPKRKSPKATIECVCEHCGAHYLSPLRSRWCVECRPACYAASQRESETRCKRRKAARMEAVKT